MIPGYIEYPSWMGTKKGFTPLSSPSTSRRAKTMASDGVPLGMVGGINLVWSMRGHRAIEHDHGTNLAAPLCGVCRSNDPSTFNAAVVSRLITSKP